MISFKKGFQQLAQFKILLIAANFLRGFLLILLFLAIGKLFSSYLPFVFPGSIIGLLLLFFCLSRGIIKIEWLLMSGNLILKYMAILFVPIGVGLINHLQLISTNWLVIVFSSVFTTLLILFLVGHVFQFLNKDREL
jgi:holin-like protein